ncbi:MAG: adenylyltransferase/cytidyltransferase family protein [Bacteroidetes bacterium]|nr:adenylyltransferase/cytidyltransferase family protein [Bacteroidota bacterium]
MTKLQKIQSKIKTLNEALAWRNELKSCGQKLVFTNGCFDLLHLGHVTYLAQAAELGEHLIVALNTDASVKRQEKGDNRPINPEHARLFVLASLEFVSAVILFDATTPISEIETLSPDVLVKGADYDPNESDPTSKKHIVGRDLVLKAGGKVQTIPLVDGFSTTNILKKAK